MLAINVHFAALSSSWLPLRRLTEGCQDPAWLQRAGWWALCIALFLRVIWALLVPVMPVSDSNAYDMFAQNIAAGHGFSWQSGELTAYWAVGTAAIYALSFSIFGHIYAPIIVLNILVGVASVALAMSLTRRWLGPVAALLAGWMLALWPLMIQFTTILASEMLFNFFVLTAFWLASMPGWKWLPRAVATGIILAAAVYIRPIALLLVPLMFLQEALMQRRIASAVAACAVTGVVMLTLILPWSLRNLDVFDRFVLISTNAGTNFWMGNNPESTGSYMPEPETGIANEVDRDRYFKQKAWEYISREPQAFMARTLKKVVLLHDRESIGVAWNEKGLEQRFGRGVLMPLKLISNLYWWLILAGAGYGLILFFQQRSWLEFLTLPPILAWSYYAAVHSITVIGDRYHLPSDPFIAMLAAYALSVVVMKSGSLAKVPKTATV